MALLIVRDVVATLGLVDANLTLGSHIYICQPTSSNGQTGRKVDVQ